MNHHHKATTESPIRYSLLFDDCERHTIEVVAWFPTEGATSIELLLPVWTPGSYLVREYSKNIESMTVVDAATGVPLPFGKSSKNTWKLETPNVPLVQVTYRLYCRELSVRTNWVERDFGFLTGAATFLTRMDAIDLPHEVRLELPKQWRDIATSLRVKHEATPTVRLAANYHELVDSPILMGVLDISPFEVGGKQHYFANALGEGLWDYAKLIGDISKIVAHEQRFWGVVPYDSYWFLNIASESGGGLEHDNNTVLMSSRWVMKRPTLYTDFLGLVSHEFFHTWNIRRLRPCALVKYDYSAEQYFKELWIAEGITSYYDDLFLVQTKILSQGDYLAGLSKVILGVQNNAGRLVQPLADSSMDAWIKFYRPDENSNNSRVSYYAKGSIVALLLDCEIKRNTEGRNCLRDVMLRLWNEYLVTGYSLDDFERITSEIAGTELVEWFEKSIRSASELDYAPFLEWYGLQFSSAIKATDSTETRRDSSMSAWLGCETVIADGRLMVKRVPRGTPADLAGLNVDDELISIDDYRVLSDLEDRLTCYQSGSRAKIQIARRGKLMRLDLQFASKPEDRWSLEVIPEPTEAQKRNLQNWIDG